ncbi:exodeoxyribonuclease III [Hoyosella sp. YIM 151337]|uniref:exodeoxyribonuclease III n=1 Tax=Hoyosella sp. YIM 151337 TaxID=2992742 RepID=UPI002235CF57|nr:exodeoxyribonuclease III [Hoyosella sp. YIM 151337]MCW4351813.1 exodeoxyribonuclease III [Hoyosella sp. YIM 151337]
MRIATWNVNSARARIERITSWLERSDVDVLAIQETKCRDDQFPAMAFEAAGYEVAHHGTNQWNGVALVSRVGLDDVQIGFPGVPTFRDQAEPRAIGANCGGVTVWSLYVPNGRTLTDPHYEYKLRWLDALWDATAAWLGSAPGARLALTGDWNIAPHDEDVWDMAVFADSTHVSDPERKAYQRFFDLGLSDAVRPFTPGPGIYTYWDYTKLRFPRREGMRIDHMLVSPALRVTSGRIDRDERKGKGASDHAPVIMEIE